MDKLSSAFALSALLALTACGGAQEGGSEAAAEDYAARINGGQSDGVPEAQTTPVPMATPQVAQPLEGAAPGAFTPGTATDPQSMTCGANLMGPFLGRPADEATRSSIAALATGASEVRFIEPGSDYIRPDPTNPRLNLMLDNLGIIRDARCG